MRSSSLPSSSSSSIYFPTLLILLFFIQLPLSSCQRQETFNNRHSNGKNVSHQQQNNQQKSADTETVSLKSLAAKHLNNCISGYFSSDASRDGRQFNYRGTNRYVPYEPKGTEEENDCLNHPRHRDNGDDDDDGVDEGDVAVATRYQKRYAQSGHHQGYDAYNNNRNNNQNNKRGNNNSDRRWPYNNDNDRDCYHRNDRNTGDDGDGYLDQEEGRQYGANGRRRDDNRRRNGNKTNGNGGGETARGGYYYGEGDGDGGFGGRSPFGFGPFGPHSRNRRDRSSTDTTRNEQKTDEDADYRGSGEKEQRKCLSQCVFAYLNVLDENRLPSEAAIIKLLQVNVDVERLRIATMRQMRRCFATIIANEQKEVTDDGCAFSRSLANCMRLDIEK